MLKQNKSSLVWFPNSIHTFLNLGSWFCVGLAWHTPQRCQVHLVDFLCNWKPPKYVFGPKRGCADVTGGAGNRAVQSGVRNRAGVRLCDNLAQREPVFPLLMISTCFCHMIKLSISIIRMKCSEQMLRYYSVWHICCACWVPAFFETFELTRFWGHQDYLMLLS